jgi:hypothetical protein
MTLTKAELERKAMLAAIKAKPYRQRTLNEKWLLGIDAVKSGALAATISGTLHGLMELPFVVPLEAAITQTQLNAKGWFYNFFDLAKKRALYRSFWAMAYGLIPKCWVHYAWINFWLWSLTEHGDMRKCTKLENATVGLLTGFSEVWFLTPVNLVKFRMQRPEWGYKNMLNCMYTIAKVEGPLAYWKGNAPVFFRNSICMLGMMGWYNSLFASMPSTWPRDLRALGAGIIGGVLGSFLSYPFEMMRAAKQHNRSFREEILRQFDQSLLNGFRRLMAGYLPGCVRITFHSAALGILLPRMKQFGEGRMIRDLKEKAANLVGAKKPLPPPPAVTTPPPSPQNAKPSPNPKPAPPPKQPASKP